MCRTILWSGIFFVPLGCEAPYYLHLANGQLEVLSNCEPVETLLASAEVSPEVRAKLELIQSVRSYAQDRLGLALSDNYTCLHDTGGEPVSWNVSACSPTRFEPVTWNFPIVGSLAYKGFFRRDIAVEERDHLISQGLDVVMRPVSAYSTLGYFTDPVLSTMLKYDDARLTELIIHELAHGTVFAKGFTDFNESLASFVGDTGSIMFLRSTGVAESEVSVLLAQREEDHRFRAFMTTVVAALDSLYELGLPSDSVLKERRKVFQAAQSSFDRSQFASGRYDHFERWEINNAALLSYRRYNREMELFEQLHKAKAKSLRETVKLCGGCASTQNPWSCLRDSLDALKKS